MLQDAVFDPFQVIVVLIQHLPRAGHIDIATAARVPGQTHHPVQVGADQPVLWRGRWNGSQAVEFALGFSMRFLRQMSLLQLPTQLRQLRVFLTLAQFALD